ncbi:hypothetical protein [Inhella proteolytica]|uniref:Uncharacterized protein n=1 Tax=Inhella proteolytica TaxID=2795029 RepID=A0A931NIR5_9BURK|nr:hypothetical protein [Inhella proteolytica]MBH9578299.1 hypothetical protein [Inhella proteolytica]
MRSAPRWGLALLLAGLSPAAWAHGGSDWMLAVAVSYSAVLLGMGAGLWAVWRPGPGLLRLLALYALALLGLAVWMGADDWPLTLGLIAIGCVLFSGAYGCLRWVGRWLRRPRP